LRPPTKGPEDCFIAGGCLKTRRRHRILKQILLRTSREKSQGVRIDKSRTKQKASTPHILYDKHRRLVLNAGTFVYVVAPDLTPAGNCLYGGKAWVVNSYVDAKGRALVNVRYALEGTMETHIELTRISPVEIPQHACGRPPKRTVIASIPFPEQPTRMMTQQDHKDQPIESLLQSAYSANKGTRWRRKQLWG
jgi:hypothetical protein